MRLIRRAISHVDTWHWRWKQQRTKKAPNATKRSATNERNITGETWHLDFRKWSTNWHTLHAPFIPRASKVFFYIKFFCFAVASGWRRGDDWLAIVADSVDFGKNGKSADNSNKWSNLSPAAEIFHHTCMLRTPPPPCRARALFKLGDGECLFLCSRKQSNDIQIDF